MQYLPATDPFAQKANAFLGLLAPVLDIVSPTEYLREFNRASRSTNHDMPLVATTYYRLLVGTATIHALHAAYTAVVELLSAPVPVGGYAALHEQLAPYFAGLLGTTEPEHFDQLADLAALSPRIHARPSFYKQMHQRGFNEAVRKASRDPQVAGRLDPFLDTLYLLSGWARFYRDIAPTPERLPELLRQMQH